MPPRLNVRATLILSHRQALAANPVDAEREHALLEAGRLIGRGLHEPGFGVEPGLRRVERAIGLKRNLRFVLLDIGQVAVEEEVLAHFSSAPGWYS